MNYKPFLASLFRTVIGMYKLLGPAGGFNHSRKTLSESKAVTT